MAQKMGAVVIPAGSTAPVIVDLPFTPSAVLVIAGGSGNGYVRSRGMLTPPNSMAIQGEEAKAAPSRSMAYWAEPGYLFYVEDAAANSLDGVGAIAANKFTLTPSSNTLPVETNLLWLAME